MDRRTGATQGRSLTSLARAGFAELSAAAARLDEADTLLGGAAGDLVEALSLAADPDQAVQWLLRLLHRAPDQVRAVARDEDRFVVLVRLLGASAGIAEFLERWPEELPAVTEAPVRPPARSELVGRLLNAVGAPDGFAAAKGGDEGRVAFRRAYRRELAKVAAWDLAQPDPVSVLDVVAAALADLADAALTASLAVARRDLLDGSGPNAASEAELRQTELVVLAMGKTGARELNYISDVDVIFAADLAPGAALGTDRMLDVATKLARLTMRGIDELAVEPALWEVDANLRPEGKKGALVRTVDSHQQYYERWASGWEFQALLKARPAAGSERVGADYLSRIQPMVWRSSSREQFVESVQKMRGRVMDHIPADEVDVQLKLGAGGLRDVEFTVQLLQLVHGRQDETVRQRSTLDALNALAAAGYIGRTEAHDFAQHYRFLRVLEHRLQLRQLRRTHLMPRDEDALRVLARAAGIQGGAEAVRTQWLQVKQSVRGLHERLFYRPLLSAVANLPDEDFALTSDQAEDRLAAIGFIAPRQALQHIAALTQGVSRRATIQRHLLPVLLQWLADGADPDYGLLAFRRISESLGETSWYLRMLRDSSGALERLSRVLSGSRFVTELLERTPEATAWFGNPEDLQARSRQALIDEAVATVDRHPSAAEAVPILRAARRREVLRVTIAAALRTIDVEGLGRALTDIATAFLQGTLRAIRAEGEGWPEFAIIGMGRYGGGELGLGSDLDVIYVQRPLPGQDPEVAQQKAQQIAARLNELTQDALLPIGLDTGLRPEGKNGPVVRSLASYAAYYERWGLTWEAQALLRALPVAGDQSLQDDFVALIDPYRYPSDGLPDKEVREVRRIKARVEAERLPQGVDPRRHFKLGRGSLSDVEWLVQLLQLQHAGTVPALRTPSTLGALRAAVGAGLLSEADAGRLESAWLIAAQARSALTLWSKANSDVLPPDLRQLEGMARLMGYRPGSAQGLQDDYLRITRFARQVFERVFYGYVED